MKRLLLLFVLVLLFQTRASGNREIIQGDRGSVTLSGKIVAGACGINLQDKHQIISMPEMAVSQLARKGKSPVTPFSIRLINCLLLEDAQGTPVFRLSFDSNNADGQFAVSGQASGIVVEIVDAQGNVAVPGSVLSSGEIDRRQMRLNYFIRLASNNRPMRAGNYSAAVRFNINYY